MRPKVILLVPTHNAADHLELWSDNLYLLDPPPDKVIFCENNSTDDTLRWIDKLKLPHELIRIWFRDDIETQILKEENEYLNIAHVRQLLLTRARHLNPDYAIFVDDDVIPPKDLIQKIINSSKDMIGFNYYRHYPEGIWLSSKAFNSSPAVKGNMYYDLVFASRICTTLPKYREKYVEDNLLQVDCMSGGCMGLSSKIIQDRRLNFYPINLMKWTSEDFGYCVKATRLGYKVWVFRDKIARHLIDKRIVRPWSTEENGVWGKGFRWDLNT